MADWDQTVDLLVVGSGAGAMMAAIRAHDLGARVLLIEKSDVYGGNSAMSGGGLWVPCNHLMAETGIKDSPEEALTYFKHITRGTVTEERLKVYVDNAKEMVKYIEEKTHLKFQVLPEYADYYPEAPGGKPGARSIEPRNFDARLLGDEFFHLRESAAQCLMMGRIAMTVLQARVLMTKGKGWGKLLGQLMMGYWFDIGWRLKTKRDRRLALGNALIAPLRLSLMDRGVPLWLKTAAKELIVENDRVVGVLAEREGRPTRIRAEKGVVLAAGGFESSPEMRKKYLPNPTSPDWSCGALSNTGDAINMGLKLGAAIDLMDDAWWGPTTVVPGEERARMLVIEKALPGCILINKRGERFTNEAAPYVDVVKAMYAAHKPGADSVPAYFIFDATYRRKYQVGPFLPAAQQSDKSKAVKKSIEGGYLKKADTLEGLAAQLGVDAAGLKTTVAKMNESARTGKDPDFHRGESLFDRYYGDQTVSPNPCLGAIDKPPFYGIDAFAGDLGTKGGLKTDERARVLKENGEAIPGLYAIGNCSASVMGCTYAGAGATIGPAMTFGYIAARDAVGK
jgi:3-oxosteroid 1-dehydrogenase